MKRIGILLAGLFAAQSAFALPPTVSPPPLTGTPGNIASFGAGGVVGASAPAVTPTMTLEGTLVYGQSNAGWGGSDGTLASLTGANYPTALMFAQNSTLQSTATPASAVTGATSLQNPFGTYFEPMVGFGFAVQQVYANNSLPSVPRFFATTWYGGQPISSFLSGTVAYNNLIAQATAFASIRPDLKPTPIVKDLVFIQGENGPYDTTYQTSLSAMIASLQTDIPAATHQPTAPEILLWQTNANSAGTFYISYPVLADLAVVGPGVAVLGPTYFSPIDTVDNIHDTQTGRLMMADIYGLVYKRIFNDGLAWNPLQPASVTRNNAVINVQFQLPPGGGSLAIDSSWIAATVNDGFYYSDSNGVGTISSVTLDGTGTGVNITLSATPTGSNKMLYYAMGPASSSDNVSGWSLARGQIISPTGVQSAFWGVPGYGGPQYINHYAVRFEESVP